MATVHTINSPTLVPGFLTNHRYPADDYMEHAAKGKDISCVHVGVVVKVWVMLVSPGACV